MLTVEQVFDAIRHLYGADRSARMAIKHSMDEFRAIESAACAERDNRIAELERQLENEKQHSKHMTQDRDLWMLTASERGDQLEKARKDAKRYRWLRDGCDYKDTEATRIAKDEWGRDWDAAIDKAMQKCHP